MNVAAALTKPNPLTAEDCTNRIFVRLDKDNNGEEIISAVWFKSQCSFYMECVILPDFTTNIEVTRLYNTTALYLHIRVHITETIIGLKLPKIGELFWYR